MPESNLFIGLRNRFFQRLAMTCPGATTLRVKLHRWRGVEIGEEVWIGYEALLETGYPSLIHIGNRVTVSIRATLIAHFRETRGLWIEDDVFVGPGAYVMPGVRIGKGSVVTAGSIVTSNVSPMTVVQGNPAKPMARCGMPLNLQTKMADFLKHLEPIRRTSHGSSS
jgi:carbonic anhydrase/acetyltransferase-like protein (isoleucine patch superfamily)